MVVVDDDALVENELHKCCFHAMNFCVVCDLSDLEERRACFSGSSPWKEDFLLVDQSSTNGGQCGFNEGCLHAPSRS